jgi:hypothetical protein
MLLSYATPLAAFISAGEMPKLVYLRLEGEWEMTAIHAMMDALATGACPKLYYVGNFFDGGLPKIVSVEESDGDDDDDAVAMVERRMQAVAEMLEARTKLGTCDGLHFLRGPWMSEGSPQVRERLLRVLLPTAR